MDTPENLPSDLPTLMTPTEVSDLLRVPARTLAHWRSQRTGPLAIRVGVHVRYPAADLQRWIDAQAATARKGWTDAAA